MKLVALCMLCLVLGVLLGERIAYDRARHYPGFYQEVVAPRHKRRTRVSMVHGGGRIPRS